ncbi:hypothetical protein GMSM_32580 [Geomonas sp. Red276]
MGVAVRYLFSVLILLLFMCNGALAKVLVIAPHPDDEALMCSGVISSSLADGTQVKLVLMTNGDLNGVASGNTRQDETVAAMAGKLGMKESDIIFLGYPDGGMAPGATYGTYGLQPLYQKYTATTSIYAAPSGASATYGHRGLGGTDYHFYEFGSHANYNKPNAVTDLAAILADFKPDHIFITSPYDQHPDHVYSYYFLKDALASLASTLPSYAPAIHTTIIHGGTITAWPAAANPATVFSAPVILSSTPLNWSVRESIGVPFALQNIALANNLKYQTIQSYPSQLTDPSSAAFLSNFTHRDEFFFPEYPAGAAPPVASAGADQVVAENATVILDGTGSLANSGTLSYAWKQLQGKSVTLSGATSANPTFTAPSGLSFAEPLVFQLTVTDAGGTSYPDTVVVTVLSTGRYGNVAPASTVTVSSQNSTTGQTGAKAVDGVIDGCPNNCSAEWVTNNELGGAYITLTWPQAQLIDKIVLYDRPQATEQIQSATLTFNDGSTIAVAALNNDGSSNTFNFPLKKILSVTLTVKQATGTATGLAEFQVFGQPAPTLAVVSGAASTGSVGYPYARTLSATGGLTPYSWSLASGSLPAGLTLNASTGIIQGTPTAAGNSNFTLQVTDAAGATAQRAMTITVSAALKVATASLSSGNLHVAYDQALTAFGGLAPYTWSVVSGALPSGLALIPGTGHITGTPMALGSSSFTVQVVDANGYLATASLGQTIGSSLLTVTTNGPLPSGSVGTAYSQTLTVANGLAPYSWSLASGTLPAGITLSSAGVLAGTPTAAINTIITVQVQDSWGDIATKNLSLSVTDAAHTITVDSTVFTDASTAGTTISSPSITTKAGGELLLAFIDASGPSTGANTTVSSVTNTGTALTWTKAVRSNTEPGVSEIWWAYAPSATTCTVTATLSLSVSSRSITVVSLLGTAANADAIGAVGSAGALTGAPYVSLVTTRDNSLVLGTGNDWSGAVSRSAVLGQSVMHQFLSPTADTYWVQRMSAVTPAGGTTVAISDSYPTADMFNLAAVEVRTQLPASLSMAPASLPFGTVGAGYSQPFSASGGVLPYSWSVASGALPAGLTLNSGSGILSGTPTVDGSFAFTVQVKDAVGATVTSASLGMTVYTPVVVAAATLPTGTVSLNYRQVLWVSGGLAPYSWSVSSGSLPGGLVLDPSAGTISGTPTAAGAFSFTVQARDANGTTGSQTMSITIYALVDRNVAPLATATASSQNSTYGQLASKAIDGVVDGYPGDYTKEWATVGQVAGAWISLSWPAYYQVDKIVLYDRPNLSDQILSATLTFSDGSTVSVGPLANDGSATAVTFSPKVTNSVKMTVVTGTGSNVGLAEMEVWGYQVASAVGVTTSSLPDGTVGVAYGLTLAASGGTSPYTWALTSGSFPAGLAMDSTGVISGTPTQAASSNVTIQATDSTGNSASKAFPLAVYAPLTVTTASLPVATVGTAYSQSLAASGGSSSYSWSVTSGTLPAGLTLIPATGVISGTPTAAGSSPITVQVADGRGVTAQAQLSVTVFQPLTVTTSSLPLATVGSAYSQPLSATGGTAPYVWSITSGTLPAGLSLTSGAIIGTPTATASATLIVQVTDAANGTATKSLTLAVYQPLAVGTAALANGTVGTAYSQTLSASGGATPYNWSISAGTLPAGLTLNGSTGAITGTPTAPASGPLTFQVADANGTTASKSLNLAVYAPLTLDTATLPTGTTGSSYSQTLLASGGATPYNWSIASGTLPAGLALNAATGAITGTPTATASASLTFKVTDGNGSSATKALTLTVYGQLTVTTTGLANGTVGAAYSQTLAVGGGSAPYSWSITSGTLPAGLTLNATTGAITGTPTADGAAAITFQVTDSLGIAVSKALTVAVFQPLSVTTTSLATVTVGGIYNQGLLATGGAPPYSWSITSGTLPAGLTLNGTTGAITGSPTAAVSATLTFVVTDINGTTASKSLTLTVYGQLAVTTATLATGTVGTAYSQGLSASGGATPYSWAVASGALPAGLSLNAATGAITGTPTADGSASFTVQVTDALGTAVSKALTLAVYQPLAVSSGGLATGTVGTAYSLSLAASGGLTPYSWSLTSGTLPAGLTLNGTTGAISGTPTAAASAALTFKVTDANNATATKSLTLTVYAPLTVATTSLANGIVGFAYNQSVSATGGATPYSWTVASGALPAGFSLNASTGAITGTSTATGTSSFTVQVADSLGGTATKALTIGIFQPLSVTTTTLATGTAGTAYSQTLAAGGGLAPYSWSVASGTLPAGLTLAPSTGVIGGTPTAAASASLTLQVTDANGTTANRALTLTVYGQLAVATTTLSSGIINTTYSQSLSATGGLAPYSWSVTSGSLPAGLSLNASTGAITGTPTTAGSSSFTVQVADSLGGTATAPLQLTIASTATIALDTTVYTDVATAGSTIASPSFTTKGAGELLLAFVSASSPDTGTNTSVSSISGGSLTWTRAALANGQRGTAEVWYAYATTALTGTVTATLNQSVSSRSITVVALTGTASGASAIGAVATGGASASAPSVSLTTTRANSWVFGVGNDWTSYTSRTVGANQTMVHQFLSSGTWDAYWVQRQTSAIASSGTAVTINDTAPTGNMWNLAAVEIRTP